MRFRLSPQLTLLVAFGGVSALNYAFGLVAATLLTPGDFGLLAFAQTLLLICGLVLQSGIPWGLTRASVGSSGARRAALGRGALIVNGGIALALVTVIGGLYALGPLETGLEEWPVALAVCAALGPFAVVAVARAAAQGTERFGTNAVLQTLEVAGKTVAGLTLAALGFGAFGAVLGFVVGAILAMALGLWFLRRTLGVTPRGEVIWPSVADSGAMFGALLGIAVILNQDLLALKLLGGGRDETGYYQGAIILANAPYFLVAAALIPVLFTRLAEERRVGASARPTGRILAAVTIFVAPMEIGLAVAPATALRLCFPDNYAAAAGELRLLAVGNTIVMLVAILSTAFQAVGRAATPARILLGVAAVELVALAVVVPRRGGEGAAATFALAAVAAALALGVVYLREVGTAHRGLVVGWLSRYGAALSAATVVGVGLGAAGAQTVAAVAASLAYVVGLWRLRLLEPAVRTLVRLDPSG